AHQALVHQRGLLLNFAISAVHCVALLFGNEGVTNNSQEGEELNHKKRPLSAAFITVSGMLLEAYGLWRMNFSDNLRNWLFGFGVLLCGLGVLGYGFNMILDLG